MYIQYVQKICIAHVWMESEHDVCTFMFCTDDKHINAQKYVENWSNYIFADAVKREWAMHIEQVRKEKVSLWAAAPEFISFHQEICQLIFFTSPPPQQTPNCCLLWRGISFGPDNTPHMDPDPAWDLRIPWRALSLPALQLYGGGGVPHRLYCDVCIYIVQSSNSQPDVFENVCCLRS